ncbi:hypothetical protein [uncultured Polaribacter sp.]|uniref:hypothetical protein n=1 Tax=uncultured Polaribacter sp. TaxID=174711 RepID=UPI00262CB42E|nr:hypothetical protein [uncultured Polaribacter sp.]
MPDGFTFINIAITSILVIATSIILFLSLNNLHLIKKVSINGQLLFTLLVFWGIITLVRGFSLSLQDWVTNFGNVYMGIAWLTPLTLLLGLKIQNWNVILKVIPVAFTFMIIVSLFIPIIETNEEWIWLLRPVNFIFLVAFYYYGFTNRVKTFLVLICYILVSFLGARRLEFLYLLLIGGLLLMDKIIALKLRKVILRTGLFFFTVLLILIFTIGYEHISGIVATYMKYQDTRTFLFREVMQELSFSEKIFGRGSLGTYYSHFFEHTRRYTINILKKPWWGDVPTRITVEVGYLQMILKGGFIMFILQITTYFYAIYLAVFKSNNTFIKRLGYYVLTITVVSLVEFRPSFTPTFILLWVSIGTVFNKKYRMMNNVEIKNLIKLK